MPLNNSNHYINIRCFSFIYCLEYAVTQSMSAILINIFEQLQYRIDIPVFQYIAILHCFNSHDDYHSWLVNGQFRYKILDTRAHTHSFSPSVWISKHATVKALTNDVIEFMGRSDDTLDYH